MPYTGTSIVDYLKSIGQDSSFSARTVLAKQYSISNYIGTAEQNTQLLGILNKPTPAPVVKEPTIQGFPLSMVQGVSSPTITTPSVVPPSVVPPSVVPPSVVSPPVVSPPAITPTSQGGLDLSQYSTSAAYLKSIGLSSGAYDIANLWVQSGLEAKYGNFQSINNNPTANQAFLDWIKSQNFTGRTATPAMPVTSLTSLGQAETQVGQTYKVPSGSNLTASAQAMGITLQQLLDANPQYKANPNMVQAGALLNYPASTKQLLKTTGTGVYTSDAEINAKKNKAIEDAKAIADKALADQNTIDVLNRQKQIQDLQTALGITVTKPITPTFTSTYEALRSDKGVSALETQMTNLKAQKLALQDSLQAGLNKVEGKLEPMQLISAEQTELQRQGQEKINAIDRELSMVQDEYSTKTTLISNIMQLKQADYTAASNAYNTAFSQAIQLQNLLTTTQDKALAQQNVQADNARANIQIILNTLKDTGVNWDTMDIGMQTQLQKLGLQAGYDTELIKIMFSNLGIAEKIVSHDVLTDADENQFIQVIKQDAQGNLSTLKIVTEGVKSTGQEDWDLAEENIKANVNAGNTSPSQIAQLYSKIKKNTKLTDSDINTLMNQYGMTQYYGIWTYIAASSVTPTTTETKKWWEFWK